MTGTMKLSSRTTPQAFARQGIVTAARGKAFGLLSPLSTGFPVLLITFGGLSKALYIAAERYADSDHVQATLRAGLQDLTIMSSKTPPDVYRWLGGYHNIFPVVAESLFTRFCARHPP